jgi:hypothetical protein
VADLDASADRPCPGVKHTSRRYMSLRPSSLVSSSS